MAKYITIFLLRFYQVLLSPLLPHIVGTRTICRYDPTCSEYMVLMIKKHGAMKGVRKGLQQLAHCHPFAKPYAAI